MKLLVKTLLGGIGLKFGYEPTRRIHFSKKERKNRVKFSKKYRLDDWSTTVFVDQFSLYRFHTKKKKRFDSDKKAKSLAKYNPDVKVNLAFCRQGGFTPVFNKKKLNTTQWIEMLETSVIPEAKSIYCGGIAGKPEFFWDNDSAIKSKASKAFYERKRLDYMPNLPKSCDFNPIENAIGKLKARVRSRNPQNVSDLKNFVLEEWSKFGLEYFQKLSDSMKNRFDLCILGKGKMTKYGRA